MSNPSRFVVSGPLSEFAPGFLEELVRRGYRPGTAAKQLGLMAQLSRWIAAEDLEPGGLRRVEIERFLQDRRASGRTRLAIAGDLLFSGFQLPGPAIALYVPVLRCSCAVSDTQRDAIDRGARGSADAEPPTGIALVRPT